MLNAFLKIDNYLIDKIFQKLSDWIQQRFGINCFVLAEYFFKFAMLSTLVISGYLVYHFAGKSLPLSLLLLYLGHKTMMVSFVTIKLAKVLDEYYASGDADGINIHRLNIYPIRHLKILFYSVSLCFYVLMELPKIILFYSALYCFADISGTYFLSCTPKPPRKGTVREWLESFGKQTKIAEGT